VECTRVALMLRDLLADDGLQAYPKTSGSKGMQLYAPIKPIDGDETSAYAKSLAARLAKERPRDVVSQMAKNLRPGKVFVDWSQNNSAKTTVAPYSLRARPLPTVSTPLTWDEVDAGDVLPVDLTAPVVLERVAGHGDLLAGLRERGPRLPAG